LTSIIFHKDSNLTSISFSKYSKVTIFFATKARHLEKNGIEGGKDGHGNKLNLLQVEIRAFCHKY
jgi:hypothetical protein